MVIFSRRCTPYRDEKRTESSPLTRGVGGLHPYRDEKRTESQTSCLEDCLIHSRYVTFPTAMKSGLKVPSPIPLPHNLKWLFRRQCWGFAR